MAEKKSFVFYHEWGAVLKKLPPEDIGSVVLALLEYSENGTVPQQLSPIADIVFTAFKPSMDRGIESWENTCKRNAENGKNGGRPPKPKKPTGLSGFSEKPKKPDSDSECDSDSERDSECDITPPTPSQGESPRKKQSSKPEKDKIKFAEFVSMTNDEYSSLVAKLGEQGAKRCIEILDNYKGSSGRTYKNDYRTILNWVVQRYSEEQSKSVNAGGNEFINAVINGVDLDE